MKNTKVSRVFYLLCLVLAAVFVITACGQPAPTPEKPLVIKYDLWLNNKVGHWQVINDYWKGLETATGGAVKVDIYSGGAMGKETEVYERVLNGVANAATLACGFTPGVFPMAQMFELPIRFDSPATLAEAEYQMLQKGYLDKEFSKIKLLGIHNNGPWVCYMNTKCNTIDDFKNMKLRTSSDAWVDVTKQLGAVPVTGIPTGESFMAVQKGIVTGTWLPWSGATVYKLAEAAKYTYESLFGTLAHITIMNKDTYNALPDAGKKYLESQMKGYSIAYSDKSVNIPAQRKYFTSVKGNEIYTLPPAETAKMNQLFAPIWDNWIADVTAKGYDGKNAAKDLATILTGLGLDKSMIGYTPK